MPPIVTVCSSIPGMSDQFASQVPFSTGIQICLVDELGQVAAIDVNTLHESTKRVLLETEILITEPAVLAKLYESHLLPRLQWCQSTFAGVDAFFASWNRESTPPFRLTRFAGMFGPPIAEWCIARIIGHERKFSLTRENQVDRKWEPNQVRQYRCLQDLTLTILGCGDIGTCIGMAAKAFGMRVVGYVRTPRSNEHSDNGDAGIDEYTTDLTTALCQADYIVSVLPSSPETRGLLGGEVLSVASRASGGKCPVLINVGRGDVVDVASLTSALDCDYISAAILDVFEKEPLPPDSALWTRPDVVVSPHVSGVTQAKDVPAVFLANYQRYVNEEDLLYEVDWSKEY